LVARPEDNEDACGWVHRKFRGTFFNDRAEFAACVSAETVPAEEIKIQFVGLSGL
jgi:hypothetical protein